MKLLAKVSLIQDGAKVSPGDEFECCCEASADLYVSRGWCEPVKKKAAKKKAKAEEED